MGDYIGFWGGPLKGYTTNLVQGSYGPPQIKVLIRACWGLAGFSWLTRPYGFRGRISGGSWYLVP